MLVGISFHPGGASTTQAQTAPRPDDLPSAIGNGPIKPTPSMTSEPRGTNPPVSPASHAVLLRNDQVLRGTVTVLQRDVVLRQSAGAEMTIPADRIVAVESDLERLYQRRQSYLRRPERPHVPRTEAELADALADARWCVDQGLFGKAVDWLLVIEQASPDHPQAEAVRRTLQHAYRPAFAKASAGDASRQTNSKVQPASHHSSRVTLENPPAGSTGSPAPWAPPATATSKITGSSASTTAVDGELLQVFTSRVQPVLLARCGRCHRSDRHEGVWRLTMPLVGHRPSGRITRENLDAVLEVVVPGSPQQSELLRWATRGHGESGTSAPPPPPLSPRDQPLIDVLIRWIQHLAGDGSDVPVSGQPRPLSPMNVPSGESAATAELSTSFSLEGRPESLQNVGDSPAVTRSPAAENPRRAHGPPAAPSPAAPSPAPREPLEAHRLPPAEPVSPVEAFNRESALLDSVDLSVLRRLTELPLQGQDELSR